MVKSLAVATTLDASDMLVLRYAAVVGDEPSITETSSPPRTPLRARNQSVLGLLLRGCMAGRLKRLQRLLLEDPRRPVVRVDGERAFRRPQRQLGMSRFERASPNVDEPWHPLAASPRAAAQPVEHQQQTGNPQ